MSAERDGNAILVENLSKVYPAGRSTADPLRLLLRSLWGTRPRGRTALDAVSFTVPRGSVLGIVGRNGSGKSTLLRLLAGTLQATSGRVSIRGRVGALLDLTSGMNPDFTGAENALLLGILAGASRSEATEQLPAIQGFSGLGEAFHLPVKSYSSGMVLRLAFSTAVHSDPDVLLVDEALAVGDAFFQQRCLRRMREFREARKTIVLVSHDPSAIISLCDRALWLESGRIAKAGATDAVVRHYLAARYRDDCALEAPLEAADPAAPSSEESWIDPVDSLPQSDGRFGDGRAEILGVVVRDASGRSIDVVAAGETVRIVVTAVARDHLSAPLVGFTLRNRLGDVVTATNTEHEDASLPPLAPGESVTVEFALRWPAFSSASYSVSPAIANGTIDAHLMCDWVENALMFRAHNPRGLFGWLSFEDVSVRTCTGGARITAPTGEPQPPRIVGTLERPSRSSMGPHELTTDRRLFVSGWAFSSSSEAIVVRARVGDAPACETRPDTFREDVAQAHPLVPGAGRSGFGLLVPVPRKGGEARLLVEAISPDDREILNDHALEIPSVVDGATRLDLSEKPSAAAVAAARRAHDGAEARVLFVSHNFNLEGAPRSLLDVGTRLDRTRFRPAVIGPEDGPLRSLWRERGVTTRGDLFRIQGPTLDDYEAAIRRAGAIHSPLGPDLVVANTMDAFWGVDLARDLGVPSVWIVRESVNPVTYFFERWPVSIAERAAGAFGRASRVLFVSRATQRMFASVLSEDKSCVVPNGLELGEIDRIRASRSVADARRSLKVPKDRPILVCVGTTCERKGQLVLLRALAQLGDLHPRPYCLFVGARRGVYLDAMEREVANLGLAEHARLDAETEDALTYYRAADVFVCPSFQESLPRVVLEAMAFSLPVVASDVHGIPELVRDGSEGVLVAAGNEAQLAEALRRVLGDRGWARALGTAARQRVEKHFALERSVDRYQDLFEELVSRRMDAGTGIMH
jgi:ABC-type polysaccharide/polyol phosphate transport system ATPase subunit/glycosyltransferase involved in cell wall biosynthesis